MKYTVFTNFDILLTVHLSTFILTLWRRNYYFKFQLTLYIKCE